MNLILSLNPSPSPYPNLNPNHSCNPPFKLTLTLFGGNADKSRGAHNRASSFREPLNGYGGNKDTMMWPFTDTMLQCSVEVGWPVKWVQLIALPLS